MNCMYAGFVFFIAVFVVLKKIIVVFLDIFIVFFRITAPQIASQSKRNQRLS